MPPAPSDTFESGADGAPTRSGGHVVHFELSVEQVSRCLPDYEVTRVIGSGAMGIVYEANHKPLQRRVALKILPPGLAAREATILRFLREAEIVARIHHEHIVPIYDVGSKSGLHYIAMRFVPGVSLDKAVSAAPLSPREVAGIGLSVARALAFAHNHGIVHRDVKPANILREPDGRVSLTDFGLARVEGSGTMTESGALVGTPNYMSPEQIQGSRESVDGRSDLYSLGITLYELLAGRPPFQEATTPATLRAILEKPAPRLKKFRSDCPRELEIILDKSIRKDPRDRYANSTAFAEDLERFLAGEPIFARRESLVVRASRYVNLHRGVFIAGTIALLLAIGTVFLLKTNSDRSAQNYLNAAQAASRDTSPEAIDTFKNNINQALRYTTTRLKAYLLRAQFALKAGDRDPSLVELALRDCLELLNDPSRTTEDEIYALYLQARFALRMAKLEVAQDAATRAVRVAPAHPRTLMLVAIVMTETGRTLLKQGEAVEAEKQLREAESKLKESLHNEIMPATPEILNSESAGVWAEAHMELGSVYSLLGETDFAMREFEYAEKLDPRNAEIHARKAELLRERGNEQNASIEEALAKAINPFINVSREAPELGADIKDSVINFSDSVKSLFARSKTKPGTAPATDSAPATVSAPTVVEKPVSRPAKSL